MPLKTRQLAHNENLAGGSDGRFVHGQFDHFSEQVGLLTQEMASKCCIYTQCDGQNRLFRTIVNFADGKKWFSGSGGQFDEQQIALFNLRRPIRPWSNWPPEPAQGNLLLAKSPCQAAKRDYTMDESAAGGCGSRLAVEAIDYLELQSHFAPMQKFYFGSYLSPKNLPILKPKAATFLLMSEGDFYSFWLLMTLLEKIQKCCSPTKIVIFVTNFNISV